jgi:hypothetical protein
MQTHRNPRHSVSNHPTPDNQLTVDPRALDAVLICIASAARFIERHDSLTLGPLADSIQEIGRAMREIRTGRVEPGAHEPFEVVPAMNKLNLLIARADALMHAARHLHADVMPDDATEARRRHEHLAHLIGDAAEATEDAAEASLRLVDQLETQQAGS